MTRWELWLFLKECIASNTHGKSYNLSCVTPLWSKTSLWIPTWKLLSYLWGYISDGKPNSKNFKLRVIQWQKEVVLWGRTGCIVHVTMTIILCHHPLGNYIFGYAIIFSNPDWVGKHLKEFQCQTTSMMKKIKFLRKKSLSLGSILCYRTLHVLDASK